MSNFFILIASARTGGTYLTTLLNSHSDIRVVGEPFAELGLKSHEEQTLWIDHFVQKHGQRVDSLGMRSKVMHIAKQDFFCEKMQTLNAHFIFLERNNLIKRAISRIRSIRLRAATGFNNVQVKGSGPLPPDEEIPLHLLKKHLHICEEELKEVKAFQEKVMKGSPPMLSITYEDIVAQPDMVTDKVLQFLVKQPGKLQARVKKYTHDDLSKSVPNYWELRQAFRGTAYEHMF